MMYYFLFLRFIIFYYLYSPIFISLHLLLALRKISCDHFNITWFSINLQIYPKHYAQIISCDCTNYFYQLANPIQSCRKFCCKSPRMFDRIFTRVRAIVRCQSLSDCWLHFNLEKAKVYPPLFPIPPTPPVEREKSFTRLVGA